MAPVLPVDRTAELAENAAARANRRKALMLSAIIPIKVAVVVAVVVALVGSLLVAAALLVVISCGGTWWIRRSSAEHVAASLGARPSSESDRPRLHNLVEGLCATMGLDHPSVMVVDSPLANAMVVGRDIHHATLIVTSALEPSLSLVELEGVLAHELVHIKRDDAVLGAVAAGVVRWWSLVIGVEAGEALVHRLVGPGREFSADQRAAQVVRYPDGIASALSVMAESDGPGPGLSGASRLARMTRWLWIDPIAGSVPEGDGTGDLDDTRVRAAALMLG